MKKFYLIFTLILLSMAANADQSGKCGANLTWTFADETMKLTISGDGNMDSYNYSENIPWYFFRQNIQIVVIESGVTSISKYAFSGCTNLTSVTIPNSVVNIEDYAFYGCSSLTAISIPNSVTTIKDYAFQYCSRLASVILGNSVTSIGSSVFYGCNNLTTIELHCKEIDTWFYGISTIKEIIIGDEVETIVGGAFNSTDWFNTQSDGLIYHKRVLL